MEKDKTFFGELIQDLLSAFKRTFGDWIKKIWNRSVPDEIKPEVALIIDIVERIKTFVDGPQMDLLVWCIPGTWDDKALAWARERGEDYTEWLRKTLGAIMVEENLIDKPTTDYSRGDLQTIATEMTARTLDMPYGQAAITSEVGFQNLVRLK